MKIITHPLIDQRRDQTRKKSSFVRLFAIVSIVIVFLFASKAFAQTYYGICGTHATDSDGIYIENLSLLNPPTAKNTNLNVTLHVMFHVVCSGAYDSTGDMTTAQISNCLDSVNKRFSGSGIQFVQCGNPQFIHNSPFYRFQKNLDSPAFFPWYLSEDSLCNSNDGYAMIDIYVLHTISKDSSIAGYTYQPKDVSGINHHIFVARQLEGITSHLENGQTVAHELGHFFGLLHTNGDTTITSITTNELVNGSNGTTAGDRIQDTHADPCNILVANIFASGNNLYPYLVSIPHPCMLIVPFCDANGQTYDPLQNEMISFPGNYFNSFTQGQFNVMYTTYLDYYAAGGRYNIYHTDRFQGNSGGFDLYVRDCLADIGDQPDVESVNGWPQIWESPDIWNCRTSNNCPVDSQQNQHPGWADTTKHNYLRVLVSNKACNAIGQDSMHVYWTFGSTGEKWPNAWDSTHSLLCSHPGGGEIGKGILTNSISPGHSEIYTFPWKAPYLPNYSCLTLEPYNDGAPMICFLTRLTKLTGSSFDPMYLEQGTFASPHKVGDNVYNNNNIATHNTSLVNLPGALNAWHGGITNTSSSILIQNSEDADATFDLHIVLDTTNLPATFFDMGGNVTVRLDDDLWSSWVSGGQNGTNVSVLDPEQHQITVSDNNAVIANVFMPLNNVDQGLFTFNRTAEVGDSAFLFDFSVYQTIAGADTSTGSVCHFWVNNYWPNGGDDAEKQTLVSNIKALQNSLNLAPNPASNSTKIRFNLAQKTSIDMFMTDMTGKVMATIFTEQIFDAGAHVQPLSLDKLASGVYFVTLRSAMWSHTSKLIVTKN